MDVKRQSRCGVCANLKDQLRAARDEYDRSKETDLRIRTRRHMREIHGVTLPIAW